MLPTTLLERQLALGLDAVDINIILHLVKHWWKADELPFPSKKQLATCMKVHPSTIQRRIAKLERDGLIKRRKRMHPDYGQQTNYYDLTGLVHAATPYAEEALEARKEKKKEASERRARKGQQRSGLRVVAENEPKRKPR